MNGFAIFKDRENFEAVVHICKYLIDYPDTFNESDMMVALESWLEATAVSTGGGLPISD